MIVRDEARLLPASLEAAKGVWDELVVVDTGSSDQTVQIAEAFGAKVSHFEWAGDFSAARNASLERATGEWILILDADEMMSPQLKQQLKAIKRDRNAGAATVLVRNQLAHGHHRLSRLLRLFRRDGTVRFAHRIHEDVTPKVAAYLERTGKRLKCLDGPLEHLGYQRERMKERGKRTRDFALLDAAVSAAPGDLYSWFKLLEQAHFWKDSAAGARAGAGALAAMARAPAEQLKASHYGGDLLARLVPVVAPEGVRASLQWLEERFGLVTPSAELHLKRGELREQWGLRPGARADFVSALAWRDAPGDTQLATVRPLLGLARLAISEGDLTTAQRLAREALAFNPADLEALTLMVMLLGRLKGHGQLTAFAGEHRRLYGETPELLAALGEAALLAGQTAQAAALLGRAAKVGCDGWVTLRLAQALLADGQTDSALDLATGLMAELPQAGLGVLVCDLIAGRDSKLELPLQPAEAGRALRGWVDMVRLCEEPGPLQRLREAAPAVEAFFPWLSSYLTQPLTGAV